MATLATFTTALAEPPQDTQLSLGEVGLPTWMPSYANDEFVQPAAAYPISAACAPVAPESPVTATSTKDVQTTWTLAAWTAGRTLSEQKPNARVGDFCKDIPDEDDIDWQQTIAANAAATAEGRIAFDTGAKDPRERLLFIASGATTVTWVMKDGTRDEQTFKIGAMSSSRPYRIFATRTDEANSAAFIDLSGKFVKFFGDSQLLSSRWHETSAGVSNVVYGLDYNPSVSKMLTFRYTVNEATGAMECPQGQFVLAYYDTETKDHMVAHVVVEVCPPVVNTLYAGVGDALSPAGGGYSVSNLYAVVVAGLSRETTDPYSPYLEQYTAAEGEEVTDPDHGKVFAIAPTDVTTSPDGVAMPWKADIYWQTADPMKTRWTFEHDWYLVSWPAEPIRVVVAPSDATPGCPFLVPTNYAVSTMFRMPESVSVAVDQQTGEVSLRGGNGGKILIRLTNDSGTGCPWYMPVEMTDYRDKSVTTPWTIDWPVGMEITPRLGIEAGPNARAMSERVDDKLPGYIYMPESPGRNWNPRLYHAPAGSSGVPDMSSLFGDVDGTATESTDPYAALESSIYAVNESDGKIQVWWRANFQGKGMPTAVTYPALVQNYRASWETTMAEGLLPEIALSSGLGSADPAMTACSGRSLLLEETNSTASINLAGTVVDAAAEAIRAGFSIYVPADEPATPGRLARLVFGDRSGTAACTVEARLERVGEDGWQVAFAVDGTVTNQTVKAGQWNNVAVNVPLSARGQGIVASFGAAEGTGGAAATYVALDNLALWYGDTAAPESESDVIFGFSFTDDDLATLDRETGNGERGTVRTAFDVKGNVLRCKDCAALGMGASKAFSLSLATENGVAPELYYQNVQGLVGFNPNEEHAFLEANGSEYVAWALRNDLNQAGLSEPVVMVMYSRNGKGAMQAYRVVTQNDAHSDFVRNVVVGNLMLPPGPIGKVPGWGTENDIAVSPMTADDSVVAYIDRKNQMWARRDGMAFAVYSYPMQPGFYCPSLGDAQLPVGTVVGWMNCTEIPSPSVTDLKDGFKSMPWTWLAEWPDTNSVPTMCVGQVLTVAENGLPEVWNAASMAIAYPSPTDGLKTVVELIDPTAVQCSEEELPIDSNFADEYGFELGPSGTTTLRKGKYYFTGLPPSISDRFYIDTNADPAFRVCLLGRRVVKESGGSYLQLNVLTDAERTALKSICTLESTDVHKQNWDKAIDSLAREEVVPSVRSNTPLNAKEYAVRKTYAFPSQKAFDNWTNKLDAVNFMVSSVKSELEFEFQLVTGPMPPIAGAEYLCATCGWTVVRTSWKPLPRKDTADVAAKWEKDGLAEYTELDWNAENSGGDYLSVEMKFTSYIAERLPITGYLPRDHYALVANGAGAGWVTLVENDNPDETQVKPGLPVSMKVLRVLPKLYTDGIAVLKDPLNKLSEQLTLQYRTPLGSATDNFEFEWRRATPAADGTLSTESYERAPWEYYRSDAGLYSILLGANGARPDEYVNTYYTLHYRARPGTLVAATVGTGWSDWAPEQLAEGWLQRVLNEVTPFAQRVEDFYQQKADSWISMLEEIGRPYQGDVALNNDNLTEVGLLELYQTLFNRAEMVLQSSGTPSVDMSKQMLLAQTRMGEFYSLLGAEAYSDAKNPLVSQQSIDGKEENTINLPSSTFCFANQVPTLLDEELALLRGRSASTAYPRMTEAPCYNRLAWNFTKDLVEGEPAYVANYGIRARDGVLDVNCAAAQYPQGHGDAWGHYLSVLSGYYRLLRNPLFDWTAAMGEMLMDQKLTNVDYQDEEKFADAVSKLARTGLDAMELTVRKQYRDNDGEGDGYRDSNTEQAFGYGEWATRTGLAAAYGWMTVNALLPTNDAPYKAFTDRGIMKIDRTTAAQLPVICDVVQSLENRLAATDAGMNPLGLSEDAIPFDIDPDRLAQKDSHFEQILERAEKALANCKTALDYANKYGNRISMLSREETSLVDEIAEQELAYNNQLIAIYGTPFAGDIGPGGTYPQGYEGPDLYNYNYMDLEPYALEELSTAFTNSWTLKWGNAAGFCDLQIEKDAKGNLSLQGFDLGMNVNDLTGDLDGDTLGAILPGLPSSVRKILSGDGKQSAPIEYSLSYNVSEGGIRAKPITITGVRATEGSIQSAYRKYIVAYKEVEAATFEVDMKWLMMNEVWDKLRIKMGMHLPQTILSSMVSEIGLTIAIAVKDVALQTAKDAYEHEYKVQSLTAASIPIVTGAGTTVVASPQAVANAATAPGLVAAFTGTQGAISAARAVKTKYETAKTAIDIISGVYGLVNGIYDGIIELRDNLLTAALGYDGAVVAATEKYGALAAAEAAYRAEVYKGEMLQDERAAWRRKIASRATMRRYLDMYNRVERNAALAKYSTSFDTAQRYVWELAKVYDYETGLLSTDPQSGKKFLADIVATRSLGQEGIAIDSSTTDGGLWDVVTRMRTNWGVLKGRLGINNPDKPEKWFSLRYELFRIRPGVEGDGAWRRELKKYWVDDLRDNTDFVRHCQPLESEAVVLKEPGLIIPFSTSINNAENFFGKTLQGGESQFSSSDYATKIAAVGVDFPGYERLTTQTADGLAIEPNVYLVPVGSDYMRAPAGNERKLVKWNIVDQVLPLPYSIGSTQLDDVLWISSFSGLDGTSDSVATIRRHSTLRVGDDFKSTRLVGRSVWNDKWMLVIPASSLNSDRAKALEKFVNGIDDIKLGIKAYSRHGN